MPVSFSAWQLLGLIVISGMWWMYYVMSKDRHRPEPLRRLLLAFGLGMVACAISLATYRALEALRFPDLDFKASLRTAVYCFGVIGPVEEGAKILMAYLFVFRWREYDEPIDGFVYAASLSLGFACLENFRTVADAGWQRQLASTVALPITHALFGSIWGLGIAHASLSEIDPRNDGKILWYDQLVPGNYLLGFLNADHWAVGTPLDASLPWLAFLFEDNIPRLALVEGAIEVAAAILDDEARRRPPGGQ
jgi:RsiW-degrading membrane proteinase PrsW (M82 family)